MKRKAKHKTTDLPSDAATPQGTRPTSTRREFFGDVGKKALYIAPVVMTLSASQAIAASNGSCGLLGYACIINDDCCDFLGVQMKCSTYTYMACAIECCCVKAGKACLVDEECCEGNTCNGGFCS